MLSSFIALMLSLLCVFLILLILIQRGKGGGLAGAFGGMGGQSAFGTKAGDAFMRITIVTVAIWFLVCIGIHILSKPGKQDSGMGFDRQSVSTSNVSGAGSDTNTEP